MAWTRQSGSATRMSPGWVADMRRGALRTVAALLAAVALAVPILYFATVPTALTVAVPAGGQDFGLIDTLRQVLDRERADIRLRVVPTADLAASAQALESGAVDLAVVRSDVLLPANGHSIAVLHKDAAVIVAVADGVDTVADLAGRRVGVVQRHPADVGLMVAIARHYGLPLDDKSIVPVAAADVARLLVDKAVDVIAVVGPTSDAEVAAIVREAASASGGAMTFIAVPQAEAISQRSAMFETSEIVAGAFGGRPPRPAEAIRTVGNTHRLVGRGDLDAGDVAILTRSIFEMRPRLARLIAAANLIEAPDTAKSAVLPIHQGALDYIENDEESFFDRYGDWVYVAITIFGFGGSLAAAVASRLSRREHRRADHLLERLLAIIAQARQAATPEALDLMSLELDGIVAQTVTHARQYGGFAHAIGSIGLAIDGARAAIAEQRTTLSRAERGLRPDAEPRLTAIDGGRG